MIDPKTTMAVSSSVPFIGGETQLEIASDALLGVAFLVTAIVAGKRLQSSRQQSAGGQETTVVAAFYGLILMTSILRAIWFLIPSNVWQPSYTPLAAYAFESPSWVGATLSELTVTAGSLALFSIFILILVYWADILKKYFHPGARRSLPMVTFISLVGCLGGIELVNLICFLCRLYTTEGMILVNAIVLAIVSVVCVVEITIFSHRFRTVLKTLGAINQVSTDSQVKRIVWITVTGNLFFFSRAALETVFTTILLIYWKSHGSVDKAFSHQWWDTYTMLKYWSEIIILSLMLYILQSRFTQQAAAASQSNMEGYEKVPDSTTTAVNV